MLNHWRKTKLMNTDQHDPVKCQKRITLLYLKSLPFSINTLCFHVGTLLYYCTSTALCSLHGNEFIQHFVWKCESLSLSWIRVLVLEDSSQAMFRYFKCDPQTGVVINLYISSYLEYSVRSGLFGTQWLFFHYTSWNFGTNTCFPKVLNKSCLSCITVFSSVFFL